MGSEQIKGSARIISRDIFWLFFRILPLIVLQFIIEIILKMNWLAFLGPEDLQILFYELLKKGLLTLYLWFFLALFKRFVVPTLTKLFSPAIDKFVAEPRVRGRSLGLVRRYLTYVSYVIAIIILINIWAYSYIGTWVAGALGTSIAIVLTFLLGLFTSSVLGNILAYWVLSNVTKFKRGDRVQIGDAYGDILDTGLFFTRIRTIKDEIISIPNLSVVGKELKNFSALGTVLIHVPVTLGYDVDKEKAKALLIKCAEETEGVLTEEERKPFVLLIDLEKYYVTYEINAYTDKPNELVKIKSELIDNILTEFKKENIELLSPTYITLRG